MGASLAPKLRRLAGAVEIAAWAGLFFFTSLVTVGGHTPWADVAAHRVVSRTVEVQVWQARWPWRNQLHAIVATLLELDQCEIAVEAA